MTRPIAIGALLVLGLSALATAATGVHVEGVFVRAGTFTVVTEVEVGTPVQLLVRIRDISDVPLGVAGGLVDVTWDSDVLELQDAIDGNASDTTDVRPLFEQAIWNVFCSGVKTGSGTLEDMGAGRGIPPDFPLGDTEVFFTLNFTTVATGQANMDLTPHDFGVMVITETEAEADQYQTVDPALNVVASAGPGPGPGPEPEPGIGCFGPALAVGTLMLAGCSRTISSRRRRDR